MNKARLSTLCYIENDDKYLMLHRIIKANDINHNKWIGVGGHFEDRESPDDCLLREVREETGYTLTDYKFRGIVTFIYGSGEKEMVEYIQRYKATGFKAETIPCDEGVLEWVPKDKLLDLELWEGDKIFLRLLSERDDFFSLKLVYDESDELIEALLDGKAI